MNHKMRGGDLRTVASASLAEGADVAPATTEGSKWADSRVAAPVKWLRMLAEEMHWSFVLGVVITYGVSQGLGGSMYRVATKYYMKDVQKVQPSQSQFYWGITSIPWIVKPLWGLLTDVLPVAGYRRRPYFILSGFLGIFSMLALSFYKVPIFLALVLLTAVSASTAIADVTIDACVAQNSISHPSLASEIQSLCAFSSSIGSLLGFVVSGILIHLIGPMGLFGLLSISSGLPLILGFILDEPHMPNFDYKKVNQKFLDAGKAIWATLQCGAVWRPALYMYISLAISLNISEGMFYWYTAAKGGPSFSQETIGFLFSIGSVGSLLGAVLYHHALKNYPFRDLCLWTQVLFGLSGMLDLVLVLRWNLRYGVPDYVLAVVDEGVTHMIGRLKWMPLLVLSSKLCPNGIEGTFFALLMSIDNAGLLTSSWFGGILLHVLKVTRTEFGNLWLAILVSNVLRVAPLCLLFLIPGGDPNSSILPTEMLNSEEGAEALEGENLELVSLVGKSHDQESE